MNDVVWTQVFIETSHADYLAATNFWKQVVGAVCVPGESEATLIPATGDPYVAVRATDRLRKSVSVGLGVRDGDHFVRRALDLGAQLDDDGTLRSPGEFRFEVGAVSGAPEGPAAVRTADGSISRLDQVCIELPPPIFDAEVMFWHKLTGWEIGTSALPEFRWLVHPRPLPIRIVFQRLGDGHRGRRARGHIDLACGAHVDPLITSHLALGATAGQRGRVWHTMQDPTGLTYCLTERDPDTGGIASSDELRPAAPPL